MRCKEENEHADKIKHQKLFMKLLLLSFILFLFPDSCNIYLAYFIFQLPNIAVKTLVLTMGI